MREDIQLLRHMLATILYRLDAVTAVAPDGFETFQAGHGIRTPGQIIRHMSQIMQYTHRVFDKSADVSEPQALPFTEQAQLFHSHVTAVDSDLKHAEPNSLNLAKKLIQGGFSDIFTHIGQLAMLSRMAGRPVSGRDYSQEPISAGD